MSMQNRYRSADRFTTMVTPTGRHVVFHNNVFTTDDEELIKYLDKEVKNGVIFVDEGEERVDISDPMAAIMAQVRRQMAMEQAGAQIGDITGGMEGHRKENAGITSSGQVAGGRDGSNVQTATQQEINKATPPTPQPPAQLSSAEQLKAKLAAQNGGSSSSTPGA